MSAIDKPQLIKTFINLLDSFLSDLEISFPAERDIKSTKGSLKMAAMVNPRMIVEEFVKYTSPYKSQLFNKDHHFFMDLSNFDLDQSSMMKGVKIIELLKTSDPENTEAIFNYMQKLFRLGEKIIS